MDSPTQEQIFEALQDADDRAHDFRLEHKYWNHVVCLAAAYRAEKGRAELAEEFSKAFERAGYRERARSELAGQQYLELVEWMTGISLEQWKVEPFQSMISRHESARKEANLD